jgi:hypothetical protein
MRGTVDRIRNSFTARKSLSENPVVVAESLKLMCGA